MVFLNEGHTFISALHYLELPSINKGFTEALLIAKFRPVLNKQVQAFTLSVSSIWELHEQ